MLFRNLFETPNDRIVGITDGVYAIAMTILALEIGIPAISEITSNTMMNQFFLNNLLPQIIIYLISFFIIAIFWENSLLLFNFEEVDTIIQSLNFVALALICLIPFNTGFLFRFIRYNQPSIFFSGINLIIAILYLIMFLYVFRKRIVNILNEKEIFSFNEARDRLYNYFDKNVKKDNSKEELTIKYPHLKKGLDTSINTLFYMVISPVLISSLALICAFIYPVLSIFIYIILFILHICIKIRKKTNFNFNELNDYTDDELELINNIKKYKNIKEE